MRQIKVKENVWEKLKRFKLDLKVKTINDVISKFFKLISKFKLKEELKNV